MQFNYNSITIMCLFSIHICITYILHIHIYIFCTYSILCTICTPLFTMYTHTMSTYTPYLQHIHTIYNV